MADIGDVHVNGIEVEELLHVLAVVGGGVEDGGEVHQHEREDVVEVLHVLEYDEQRREYEAASDVEDDEADYGVHQHEEADMEGNSVHCDECEEYDERKTEVYQ